MSKKTHKNQSPSIIEAQQATIGTKVWLVAESATRMTTEEMFNFIKTETHTCSGGLNSVEFEVGIGTDSQVIGRNFRFVTVVCLYKKGRGGFYFYKPESLPRDKYTNMKNQKLRMFDEVAKSIDLSMKFQEATGISPVVHIDASPAYSGEFTSNFSEQLRGYAQAMGFKALIKPESYVASGIADSHSKSKSQRKERRRLKKFQATI
jgi:uncharacterized protein